MATPGDSITLAKPYLYVGDLYPTPSAFPSLSLASRAAWPTGWSLHRGYQNGVVITVENPKVAITTSDLGNIAWVGTGAHGVQIQVQLRRPTATILAKLNSFYETTKTAAVGPPAYPAATLWAPDPTDELGTDPTSEFRVGVEGISQAGGLYATQKILRVIAFRVQQGGNIANRFDHTGNDAGLFPTLTVQALPYTVTSGELTLTGLTTTDIKSDRMLWANIG